MLGATPLETYLGQVRVFMSFDVSHDQDLKERLMGESLKSVSGFEIVGCSEPSAITDAWKDRARRRIGAADEVIFICGEHTEVSAQVCAEIGIAREQQKPYFLLWGRRDVMCKKPIGAKPDDCMYSWTASRLREQIAVTLRLAFPKEIPEHLKRR